MLNPRTADTWHETRVIADGPSGTYSLRTTITQAVLEVALSRSPFATGTVDDPILLVGDQPVVEITSPCSKGRPTQFAPSTRQSEVAQLTLTYDLTWFTDANPCALGVNSINVSPWRIKFGSGAYGRRVHRISLNIIDEDGRSSNDEGFPGDNSEPLRLISFDMPRSALSIWSNAAYIPWKQSTLHAAVHPPR